MSTTREGTSTAPRAVVQRTREQVGHQQQLVEVPALQSLSLRGGTVVSPAQHQFVGSPEVVLVPHPQPLRTAPVQVEHVRRAENAERCRVATLPVVLARGGGCGHFTARDCAVKQWVSVTSTVSSRTFAIGPKCRNYAMAAKNGWAGKEWRASALRWKRWMHCEARSIYFGLF